MSRLDAAFNRSRFSNFLNRRAGRAFRLASGSGFLIVGYIFRDHPIGILSMVWGALACSAGAFDVCYISLSLGGPFLGAEIRRRFPPPRWGGPVPPNCQSPSPMEAADRFS